MIRILILLIVLLMSHEKLIAKGEDSDPIIVKLSSTTQLMPLYLGNFDQGSSGLPEDYINRLQKVLEFDLGHNGMTYLVSRDSPKEQMISMINGAQAPTQDQLRKLEAFYVIKIEIRDQKLSAIILATNNQIFKKVEGIPLTGTPKEDRRQMHMLADQIFKTLFGSEGIATTRILYTVKNQDPQTKKWMSDVWEADYDGSNARQVTRDIGYCVTPAYVPPKAGFSSGSFFFVSYLIGQPKIYMASLKDGQGRRFSPLKGNQLMPCINRQRDLVAFISDVTGNPDLFVQQFSPESGAVGKPRQIFSTHLATQGTPTFSPDGKKVAFVSNKDGSPKIYVMEIPEEGVALKDIKSQLITKHTKESTAPCWSPDGTKIAYCASINGNRQIWVYDFTKNEERQLTQGRGNKENPTWAPNSLHIIFNSSDANLSDLYLINLNQPEAVKISSGPGEKRFPSWEPRVGKQ